MISNLKQSDINSLVALVVSAVISWLIWYKSFFNDLLRWVGLGDIGLLVVFVVSMLIGTGFGTMMLNLMYSVKKGVDKD